MGARSVVAFAGALAAMLALAPATLASDVTGIGYVDETALANVPRFADANRQLEAFRTDLNRRFAQAVRAAKNSTDQQRIAADFQKQLTERQQQIFAPLFSRAQVAIASVASSKNLSVVLDKRIVVYGGTDVTKEVAALLSDFGDPVPAASTPPPANVGYVDQTQIDAVPSIKAANDAFGAFSDEQNRKAQAAMRAAKTDADRHAALGAYQKTIDDRRKTQIEPLVDRTRSVIAGVAKKRGLVLVVDRGSLVYGGVDITSDVASALK